LEKTNLDGSTRARVGVIAGLTVVSYIVTVYLIFFLLYTPLNIDDIRGVQGRYFVIILPIATIFLAAIVNIGLPRGVLATIAFSGSLLSGIATFEALWRAHW
jgi:hypothetical protein